ncbi:MAG TPA: hypothetical protein VE863_05015, partial [Pyrinomonadaceae bacterium]|nr:hypothetical protein [Pyrinomonadaceae bacterium]
QNYKVAGISCGPHPEYGAMCVLAMAGGFTDSVNAKSQSSTPAKITSTKIQETAPANTNKSNNKSPRKF